VPWRSGEAEGAERVAAVAEDGVESLRGVPAAEEGVRGLLGKEQAQEMVGAREQGKVQRPGEAG
jgi:hypothetical protein